MKKIFIFLLICLITGKVSGQTFYSDPGRYLVVKQFTEQSKKTLNAQQRAQLVISGMHIFMKEEIEATTDFQREFNEYLDSFRVVIQIAAEVYGIYHEVTQVVNNLNELKNVILEVPENSIALALHGDRNKIYPKVYNSFVKAALDIAKDIRKVCFSETKMTEKERIKIIHGMKPKLKNVNRLLRQLSLYLKYTTFLDVWNNLLDRKYFHPANRQEIILRCQQRWKRAWWGRKVR